MTPIFKQVDKKYPVKKLTLISFLLILNLSPSFAQKNSDRVLDSLLNELSIAKEDTNKTNLIYKIAERYSHTDEKAHERYIYMGKAHAEKLHFHKIKAKFISMLAGLKHNKGDLDSTLYYHNEAYKLHEAVNNEQAMANVLVDISNVYNWQGKNAEAISYLTKAIPVLEKVKDYENLSVVYRNFSVLFEQEENYQKALRYALKSLETVKKGKVDQRLAISYISLGTIYLKTKDTVKAKAYYANAVKSAKTHHRNYDLASAYMQLSSCTNSYGEKLKYLFKAKEIWDIASPEHPLATTALGRIGETYLKLAMDEKTWKNIDDALIPKNRAALLDLSTKYLTQAIEICKKNKITQNHMYYIGVKATLEAEKGNYKQAFLDLNDNLILYDSLYSQENKNKISQIESENEIALRDKQIELSKSHIKELWLYGIIVLVILVLLFSFLIYRSRINQLKLKNKVEQQESQQKEEALILKNKITESELKAIRSQMNPHFIFNVLNNIESYILDNDAKTASRLIQKFAMLNRLILENSTQSMVKISREWKALKLYTELEAIRFNNEFSYTFDVDEDLDLEDLMIPPMLIQPLVENAIHHGLRNSNSDNNHLAIKLYQDNYHVIFIISDNGVGLNKVNTQKPVPYKEKSLGLDSIKERLEILNNNFDDVKADFEVKENIDSPGTISQIRFPKIYNQKEF